MSKRVTCVEIGYDTLLAFRPLTASADTTLRHIEEDRYIINYQDTVIIKRGRRMVGKVPALSRRRTPREKLSLIKNAFPGSNALCSAGSKVPWTGSPK